MNSISPFTIVFLVAAVCAAVLNSTFLAIAALSFCLANELLRVWALRSEGTGTVEDEFE